MSHNRFAGMLLFGAPGVGKGAQGAILGRIPGFVHVSSGDVFRSLDADSQEAHEFQQYNNRGELVPDDLTIRICRQGIDKHIADGRFRPNDDLLLLDGLPRNVRQAEILEQDIDVHRVILLATPDEEAMVRRIQRRAQEQNRADDADEAVIRRRFEVFRRETEPVLEFYPREIISEVDALGTPAEVLRSLLDCVIPVQNEFLAATTA